MDSKDKALNDYRKKIQDLILVVNRKDAELVQTKQQLTEVQQKLIGVDAIRDALANERELTKQLNGNLDTLKQSLASYKEANANLQALNLSLQTENAQLKHVPGTE